MKKIISSVFIVFFFLSTFAIPTFANEQPAKTNILALGDSLATGVGPNNDLGKGYADYLALKYEAYGLLGDFNKGFSYPGYRTTNILADLEANVEKPGIDYNFKCGELNAISESNPSAINPDCANSSKLKDAIKDAHVITLSIGANDVLSKIKLGADNSFTYDVNEIFGAISSTATNIKTILTKVKELNPDAQVVFMGYYNPFPHIVERQGDFAVLVNHFDNTIKAVVQAEGGIFVDVKAGLLANYQTYVSNPENIHLSRAGYEYVANEMFKAIGVVKEPTDTANHWADEYVKKAIGLQIFTGYEDGSFQPDRQISRIEIAAVISRTFNLSKTGATLPFTDINEINYAPMVDYLDALYSVGLVKGDGTGKYRPNASITREHVALILLRYHEHVTGKEYKPTQEVSFTDIATLSDESKRAIRYLHEAGVVFDAELFYPDRGLTRGEAAKIFGGLK
jgi:lysophospholipase L1-like esterase